MVQVIAERLMSNANLNRVWEIAINVVDYPTFMDQVVNVEIEDSGKERRCTSWTVLLNGNEMSWTEISLYDEKTHRMTFEQIDGDLAEWKGFFEVTEQLDGILARYQIEFDLGIPALADELHPLGESAIMANCTQMLEQMEIRSKCHNIVK